MAAGGGLVGGGAGREEQVAVCGEFGAPRDFFGRYDAVGGTYAFTQFPFCDAGHGTLDLESRLATPACDDAFP